MTGALAGAAGAGACLVALLPPKKPPLLLLFDDDPEFELPPNIEWVVNKIVCCCLLALGILISDIV